MTSYIVRRLLHALVVLIIVSTIVFVVIRLMPGDPILIYMSEEALDELDAETLARMRHEYGLDKPLPMQYVDWIIELSHGDLGRSLSYEEEVATLIVERMPITLHLGILAFLVSTLLGILAGLVCALRRGRPQDTIVTVLANMGITTPDFWLGVILIYIFALKLRLLPVCGYTSPFDDFWLSTKMLMMPVFCLAVHSIASLCRQTRSSMLEVSRQDHVRTAWAKGLRENQVVTRHIIKNGLIPVITLVGMRVRTIFGGSVIIETVFNIPGIGRLLVDGVLGHDYAVVQAGVLFTALIVLIANLAVDLSYGWIDPRIRYR